MAPPKLIRRTSSLRQRYPRHVGVPVALALSALLLLTGLSLPILHVQEMVFWKSSYSVWAGIVGLWRQDEYLLTVLIFFFSIIFPFTKLGAPRGPVAAPQAHPATPTPPRRGTTRHSPIVPRRSPRRKPPAMAGGSLVIPWTRVRITSPALPPSSLVSARSRPGLHAMGASGATEKEPFRLPLPLAQVLFFVPTPEPSSPASS